MIRRSRYIPKHLFSIAVATLFIAGNFAWVSDADAQGKPRPTSQSSKGSKGSTASARQSQRLSMGSRSRSRSSAPVPPRKTAQNTEKAANRQSTGQSARSVVGTAAQVTANGPTLNMTTPAGVQQIPAPPQQPRQSVGVSTQPRRVETRTSSSGKSTTLTASTSK